MDVKIQLLCMLISFLYGAFIRITLMINKKHNIFKDLLYIYIIVLLYTIIIYKINNGIFHIYFLLLILVGYLVSKKHVNLTIDLLKKIKKKIIKWYTYDNRVVAMKRKGLKRARRRLLLLIVLFLGILATVSFNLFKVWLQVIDNNNTIAVLTSKYDSLMEQEKQLKSDVNKLQDPDYVARYAREKYLYTKEGELILKMPKSE